MRFVHILCLASRYSNLKKYNFVGFTSLILLLYIHINQFSQTLRGEKHLMFRSTFSTVKKWDMKLIGNQSCLLAIKFTKGALHVSRSNLEINKCYIISQYHWSRFMPRLNSVLQISFLRKLWWRRLASIISKRWAIEMKHLKFCTDQFSASSRAPKNSQYVCSDYFISTRGFEIARC